MITAHFKIKPNKMLMVTYDGLVSYPGRVAMLPSRRNQKRKQTVVDGLLFPVSNPSK